MKRCKVCGEKFTPSYSSLEPTCQEYDCKVAFALKTVEKQRADREKKKKQAAAKETKALRDKWKDAPELKKELEKEVNSISRILDAKSGCISCNGHTTPSGGHYHSVGANGSLRYNLDNIHLQDYNCNGNKGGNIIKYDLGLIERYGKEYWEYVKFELVHKYPILKMAKHEYESKISIARGIVKWLKLQDRTFTPKERLEYRKKFNEQLGMYL